MLNSTEPQIRIDQSHCNFKLSNHLAASGWQVLFRDPGRATRGASGTQEQVLGVFENTGLPIPDIAAVSGGKLLLIEVDKSAKNNAGSFRIYREHSIRILAEINRATNISPASDLQVGFCKVGGERNPKKLMSMYDLDLVAYFESTEPTLDWLSSL